MAEKQTKDPPSLQLLKGGLEAEFNIGGVRLRVTPLDAKAPPLDAVVVEEDSFLILSNEPIIQTPREGIKELFEKALEFTPADPGSVLVKRGRPLQLLAVVHDLDQTPSWREEWVEQALAGVFDITIRRHLKTLAMPLLGTVHGRLPKERSLELLQKMLEQKRPRRPQRLWLAVQRDEVAAVQMLLAAYGSG